MSLNTVDVFQQAKIRLILLPFNGIFLRFTHNVLGRHICIAHLFGLLTPFYKKQYNFVRLSAFIFSRFSSQPYFVQCSNFLPLEAPENEIYFATFREYKIRAMTQNNLFNQSNQLLQSPVVLGHRLLAKPITDKVARSCSVKICKKHLSGCY